VIKPTWDESMDVLYGYANRSFAMHSGILHSDWEWLAWLTAAYLCSCEMRTEIDTAFFDRGVEAAILGTAADVQNMYYEDTGEWIGYGMWTVDANGKAQTGSIIAIKKEMITWRARLSMIFKWKSWR